MLTVELKGKQITTASWANLVVDGVKLGEDDAVDEVRVVAGRVVSQRSVELDQLSGSKNTFQSKESLEGQLNKKSLHSDNKIVSAFNKLNIVKLLGKLRKSRFLKKSIQRTLKNYKWPFLIRLNHWKDKTRCRNQVKLLLWLKYETLYVFWKSLYSRFSP